MEEEDKEEKEEVEEHCDDGEGKCGGTMRGDAVEEEEDMMRRR